MMEKVVKKCPECDGFIGVGRLRKYGGGGGGGGGGGKV